MSGAPSIAPGLLAVGFFALGLDPSFRINGFNGR